MNVNELKVRKHAVGMISVPVDPLSKERVNRVLDIDNFGTSKKLLNPCGFPMNDIMAYENAQSESVARTILQRINVVKDTGLTQDGRSIEEHFEDLCPASWSSPAEYVRYQKIVAENYYRRAESKAAAARLAKEDAQVAAVKDVQSFDVSPE